MTIHHLLKISSIAFISVLTSAQAHDAWMEVSLVGEADTVQADVQFRIGHGGEADVWRPTSNHVSSFVSVGGDQISDHRLILESQSFRDVKRLRFSSSQKKRDGSHVLMLDTFRTKSILDADKFDAYVAEEGITPIALHREQSGASDAPGRELYSRHFKAIVDTKDFKKRSAKKGQGGVLRPTGQLLEIVPLAYPYSKAACSRLPVEVRYKGKLLPGTTLHINPLAEGEKAKARRVTTDDKGRATIEEAPNGAWYIHVAWADVLTGVERDADYATAFASLSLNGCSS